MTHEHRPQGSDTATRWPSHHEHEPVSTRLPPATRAGLGGSAVLLAALLGVTWVDAPPPATPTGSFPVATSR